MYLFIVSLGPHPWYIKVPMLGVELELQLPTYTTAIVTQDLSHVFNLLHSSGQHCIFNPLSKARDRTRVPYGCQSDLILLSHGGNSPGLFFFFEEVAQPLVLKSFAFKRYTVLVPHHHPVLLFTRMLSDGRIYSFESRGTRACMLNIYIKYYLYIGSLRSF